MNTNEPMTQERLAAIQERLDAAQADPPPEEWSYGAGIAWVRLCENAPQDLTDLLAEVARLRHFESMVSWWYEDTMDGMTQEDMTQRAARALAERFMEHPYLRVGALGHNFYPDARAALDAALGR